MAVDNVSSAFPGRIYVVWYDASGGGVKILLSYSTNQGQNWSRPPLIVDQIDNVIPGNGAMMEPGNTSPPPSTPFLQYPMPAVGANGNLYITYVFASGNGTEHPGGSIMFAESDNGGVSLVKPPYSLADINVIWNEPYEKLEISSSPTIVVEPMSGNIDVAWTQFDETSGDDIYYCCSTNQGSSWSTAAVPSQAYKAIYPTLCANSNGIVSLSYFSQSGYIEMTESYDHGQTFSSSALSITPAESPNYGGLPTEYMGIASTSNGNVFPLWTDFRSGTTTDIYTASYNSYTRLAYDNKSFYYWPTGYNNEEPLVRTADGKVHEVFSSGGEIFYRRSSNNGSSWDVTCRLSNGEYGTNDCPSLAACFYSDYTSQLEAVWQRKLTSMTYAIWYASSSNNGVNMVDL